jgi:osmotically-inducible protein OsmY
MAGEIPNEKIRERAIEIARSTKGVQELHTYFLPKGHKSTTVSEQKIAATVKGRFLSDPDLRAFQVEVSVVHGHVVLAGFVADQACKKKCLYHASRTGGAVKVVDFIQVK